ncbi:MAG TPA: GNAT family protein [Marmoricola sp.]|nr:GNAT family protein [Marmoricola sp.]
MSEQPRPVGAAGPTDRVLALEPPAASESELDVLSAEHVSGGFEDYGDGPFDELPRGLVRGLLRRVVDGEVLGSMSWHLVSYGPTVGSRAWNTGIWLRPAHRGLGYGAAAQRLLARHLLATTDVQRVEASTDVDNVAERRALERAGFTLDGVLRGAQERMGERRDLAVYAVLRSDLGDLDSPDEGLVVG